MTEDRRARYPLGVHALLPILIACADPGLAPGPPPPPDGAGPVLGVTRIRSFHSPDLANWSEGDAALAQHAMSLGLHDVDGGFEITFMDLSGGERSWWSRTFGSPEIGVLRYTGEGWARSRRGVDDPSTPAPIDPQSDGERLWIVGRDGVAGDPAAADSANRLRAGPPWETMLEGPGLTDPMPVRFQGREFLFVTEAHQRLVLFEGAGRERTRQWNGVTVPYARVVDGELWLLAQKPAGGSRLPVPVMARSRDGRAFTAFEPLLPAGMTRVCTSPVLAPDPERGGWLLVCVEEQAPQ